VMRPEDVIVEDMHLQVVRLLRDKIVFERFTTGIAAVGVKAKLGGSEDLRRR
jgi:hypothetical protein